MRTGYRAFSCFRGSKSNRQLQLSTMYLISFGTTARTSPGKTIMDRRSVLESVLKSTAGIQLGSYVDAEGKALFELTKKKGMEGIVAKRKDSIYRPGKRTSDWLKIKARLQQEFVVGGFTAPKGSRKHLGAVVIGAYTGGKIPPYGYAGPRFIEQGVKSAVGGMKTFFTEKITCFNTPNIKKKKQ